MAEFLDLMAFAKGAELANKANWQDSFNDVKLRADEEALRQKQTTFDTALPIAQLGAEEAYKSQIGNRSTAEFQTGLVSELAKLPQDQHADYIAQTVQKRLATLDPTSPGSAQEIAGIQSFITRQAADFAKGNDFASAQKLYAALPGAGNAQGNRIGDLAKWSDPRTSLDPVNITAAGGKINPDGTISAFGMAPMQPFQFAQMMRTYAQNGLSDTSPGQERLQNHQLQMKGAEDLAKQYKEAGYSTYINPVTYQVTPVGRLDGSPMPAAAAAAPAAAPAPAAFVPTAPTAAPFNPAAPAAVAPAAAAGSTFIPAAYASSAPGANNPPGVVPEGNLAAMLGNAPQGFMQFLQQLFATQPVAQPGAPRPAMTGRVLTGNPMIDNVPVFTAPAAAPAPAFNQQQPAWLTAPR